jgi:DNA-binding IclR family transcriptional regulator
MLAILRLFTEKEPLWTTESIAAAVDLSRSTSHRYVKALCDSDLLERIPGDRLMLGPGVTAMDRIIRSCDPLLHAARDVMADLAAATGHAVTLTRLYRDELQSVLQQGGSAPVVIGYERGDYLPLFKGSSGKVILAHLPWQQLRRIFKKAHAQIADAGMGADWDGFRSYVRSMSATPYLVTFGEVHTGNHGVAAAILAETGAPVASITVVIAAPRLHNAEELGAKVVDAARAIAERLEIIRSSGQISNPRDLIFAAAHS